MFKSTNERRNEIRENMRGGEGSIKVQHALEKEDMLGKCRLFAVLTVEPGCGIGPHAHVQDAEIFFVLNGELVADDNGTEIIMKTGDVMFTSNSEVHSVKNVSKETAKLLAVVIE